jgi:hypothetical protein
VATKDLKSSNSSDAAAAALSTYSDLLWAIQSPLLCGTHPPHFEQWARQPTSPELITEELCGLRRVPIGRYFEALIQCWLATRQGITKLNCNVPIRDGGTTLGEADLLFEAEGRSYQWELAIKFYLGTGDRLSSGSWFGPQGRDRLGLKLAKLNEHQLQLMKRPESQSVLRESGLTQPESHALIKGYLFHPFSDWVCGRLPIPTTVNKGHAKGWWIHQSDVSMIVGRSQHWRYLAKREWLAAAQGSVTMRGTELGSWLNDYFKHEDRPPMLAAVDEAGNERERGFVVPDSWSPSPR